jgi:hypothetical protein
MNISNSPTFPPTSLDVPIKQTRKKIAGNA